MAEPVEGAAFGDGTGFYTKYNIIHHDVCRNILPTVLKVVDEVTYEGGTFVICDYGAADGGFSLELFGQCIGLLKEKYGRSLPIQVVYEDLPTSDYVALFKRLQGMLGGPETYLSRYPGVFVSAVGRSFYEQCLPDNSVHFGFSSTAFHWLSKKPCNLKTGLMYVSEDADEEETRCFREQAVADFTTILMHRAKELVPGGHMLLNCVGKDSQGESTGGRKAIKTMNAIWREMLRDGIITKDEFMSTTVNNHLGLSEEDLATPLKDETSPVYQSGLRLVSLEWSFTEDPRKAIWAANLDKGLLPREHAVDHVNNIKAWACNSILEGMPEGRTETEKRGIVNELFQRFENLVAESPNRYEVEIVHARLHVTKVQRAFGWE